jgi:hypothetical protein
MWSNDRFSSIRTKMWSTFARRLKERPNTDLINSTIARSQQMMIDHNPHAVTVSHPHTTQDHRTT